MDDKTQELYDRLEKNLTDYHDVIVRLEPRDIIEMADRISAYSDAYAYLTNHHDFEASEVDYLLNFQNPLEVVADEWQRRREDISDMSFALDTVFYKQDALQGGYALMSDPPERQGDTHTENQAQRPSPDTEPRHDGVEMVHGYTIKQSVAFSNDRGFALAENHAAVSPFVTWQFTEENGSRDYYWGKYFDNVEKAAANFSERIADYKEQYGVTEKKPSILGQLQAAREAPSPEKKPKSPGVSKDELR